MGLTTAGNGIPKTVCGKLYGGIQTIYAIDMNDIDTFALTATANAHAFDALTYAGGVTDWFEEINFKRGQANYSENDSRNVESSVDTNVVTITFNVPKFDNLQRAAIEDIKGLCEILFIARLFTNEFKVIGYDAEFGKEAFAEYTSTEYDTGRALGDPNQAVITFTASQHSELCRDWLGDPTAGAAPPTDAEKVLFLTTGSYT